MKQSAENKLSYLESLRGVAALIVVIDHAINMFASHLRWTNIEGIPGEIRRQVAWSPLSLIYSGIPAVWLFFLLSGFVLSYKFLKNPRDVSPIISGAAKRYFRLVIPILGAALVFCVISYMGCALISANACGFRYEKVLLEAIYTAPFTHRNMINSPLWTISWEIYGSFIVFFIMLMLFFIKNKFLIIIIFLLSIYFTFSNNYILFVVGLIFCFLYVNGFLDVIHKSRLLSKKVLLFLSFCLSLYLMSYPYPRDNIEIGSYHAILPSVGDWHTDFIKYTMIGSVIFFASFMVSPLAQRIVDKPFARFLGYISFSIYILHYPVFYLIQKVTGFEALNFLAFSILLTTVTGFLFIVSWFFAKYVDRAAIVFSNNFGINVYYYFAIWLNRIRNKHSKT